MGNRFNCIFWIKRLPYCRNICIVSSKTETSEVFYEWTGLRHTSTLKEGFFLRLTDIRKTAEDLSLVKFRQCWVTFSRPTWTLKFASVQTHLTQLNPTHHWQKIKPRRQQCPRRLNTRINHYKTYKSLQLPFSFAFFYLLSSSCIWTVLSQKTSSSTAICHLFPQPTFICPSSTKLNANYKLSLWIAVFSPEVSSASAFTKN